jgi:hypothetical protein
MAKRKPQFHFASLKKNCKNGATTFKATVKSFNPFVQL